MAIVNALLDSKTNFGEVSTQLFRDGQKLDRFVQIIAKLIWDQNNHAA